MNLSGEEKRSQNDKGDLDESLIPRTILEDEGMEEEEKPEKTVPLPPAMPPGA